MCLWDIISIHFYARQILDKERAIVVLFEKRENFQGESNNNK